MVVGLGSFVGVACFPLLLFGVKGCCLFAYDLMCVMFCGWGCVF